MARGALPEGAAGDEQGDVGPELAALAALLLHPPLPHLPPGCAVTIVPHASLCLVPFCALPLPDGAAFVERHPISQVTRARTPPPNPSLSPTPQPYQT